jgi:hypothetical protein
MPSAASSRRRVDIALPSLRAFETKEEADGFAWFLRHHQPTSTVVVEIIPRRFVLVHASLSQAQLNGLFAKWTSPSSGQGSHRAGARKPTRRAHRAGPAGYDPTALYRLWRGYQEHQHVMPQIRASWDLSEAFYLSDRVARDAIVTLVVVDHRDQRFLVKTFARIGPLIEWVQKTKKRAEKDADSGRPMPASRAKRSV